MYRRVNECNFRAVQILMNTKILLFFFFVHLAYVFRQLQSQIKMFFENFRIFSFVLRIYLPNLMISKKYFNIEKKFASLFSKAENQSGIERNSVFLTSELRQKTLDKINQ